MYHFSYLHLTYLLKGTPPPPRPVPVDDHLDADRDALMAELAKLQAEIKRLESIKDETRLGIDDLKRKKAAEEARAIAQAKADKDGIALSLQQQMQEQQKQHERDIAELERQKKALQEKADSSKPNVSIVGSSQQDALAREKMKKDYELKLLQQQTGSFALLMESNSDWPDRAEASAVRGLRV